MNSVNFLQHQIALRCMQWILAKWLSAAVNPQVSWIKLPEEAFFMEKELTNHLGPIWSTVSLFYPRRMDLGGEEAICEMRSHPGDKLAQSEKEEKEEKDEEEGVGSEGSETYFECEEDEQGFLYKDTYFEDEDSL